MNTATQTNVQQSLFSGDNELMKIDLYLDARFGQGSIQAITIMHDIAELKKMLTEEVVHFAVYPVNKYVWGTIGGHTFCYRWGTGPDATEATEITEE